MKIKFKRVIDNLIKLDDKNSSSIYKISKDFGFHKYLNNAYNEENETSTNNTNSLEVEKLDPELKEKNLKEFCVHVENLCDKYEKEIGSYRKRIEELKNNPNQNDSRRNSVNSKNDGSEKIVSNLTEKCDASTNTDDLLFDDIQFLLNKLDPNLIIEKKGKIKKNYFI